jgi:hypothetical protein
MRILRSMIPKTISFTIAQTRRDLLYIKKEENIHIIKEFSLRDMLTVLKNNPRLKRIEIPEYLNRNIQNMAIIPLLKAKDIDLIVRNITRKKPAKRHY